MSDNLDQMFTTASFAMKFAADNWREFSEFAERVIGRPVPISQSDMLEYGLRIVYLVDPARMAP